MKRISAFAKRAAIAAVLLVTIGTAEAQDQYAVRLDPDNTTALAKLTGTVTVTFPNYPGDLFATRRRVYMTDPAGNEHTYSYNVMPTAQSAVAFFINEELTEAGEYHFSIPAGALIDNDKYTPFPEITFSYNISGETVEEKPTANVSVKPNINHSYQKLQGIFSITLVDYEEVYMKPGTVVSVTLPDESTVDYRLSVGDDTNAFNFSIAEPLTLPGVYTFMVAAGALVDDMTGKDIPEVSFVATVDDSEGHPEWSAEPSLNGAVLEGEYTVTLNYHGTLNWEDDLKARALVIWDKTRTRRVAVYSATVEGNSVSFNAFPGVGDAGEYYLNIVNLYDSENHTDIDFYIPFTLTGGEVKQPEAQTFDNTFEVQPDVTKVYNALYGDIIISMPNHEDFNSIGGFAKIVLPNGDVLENQRISHGRNRGYGQVGYISMPQTFTEEGEYLFMIPKTVFCDGETGLYNDPFEFSFTIRADGVDMHGDKEVVTYNTTVTPAEGEVKELHTFNVTFNEANSIQLYDLASAEQLPGLFYVDEAGKIIDRVDVFTMTQVVGKRLTITLTQTITTEGRYALVIPDLGGILYNGEKLKSPVVFHYTVTNPTGIESVAADSSYDVYTLDGVKVASGVDADGVRALPAGMYIVNGVKTYLR